MRSPCTTLNVLMYEFTPNNLSAATTAAAEHRRRTRLTSITIWSVLVAHRTPRLRSWDPYNNMQSLPLRQRAGQIGTHPSLKCLLLPESSASSWTWR